MRALAFITIFLWAKIISAQATKDGMFPRTSATLQFAGSTGFLTAGIFKGTKNEKFNAGLLYGYTPEDFSGPLHSLSLKFIYDPFRINIGKALFFDPIQGGVFASKSFGRNLDAKWDDKYPKGYYWWYPSVRGHVFLSSTIGLRTFNSKWVENISCYFEANTNDLYLASYLNKKNYNSLRFYDIVFFGTGIRFHFRK